MKTALFSPLFLDGMDEQGNDRLDRNICFVRWYEDIKSSVGFDDFWMTDNGSDTHTLNFFTRTCPSVTVVSLTRMEPMPIKHGYPYCWRAVWGMRALIRLGYEKILFIDTDSLILSGKLASFVKESNSGWESFWCKRHSFPTAEFQILNKDAFDLFMNFTDKPYDGYIGQTMENVLPFTKINRQFDCDRYGETRTPQRVGMDFYGHTPFDMDLKFIP